MKRLAKIYDKKIGTVQVSLNEDLENEYLLKQGFEPMDIDERPFNGIYYLQGMRPADSVPTKDEISKLREYAYEVEVDGKYTAQIQRLRDEIQCLQEKIEELKQEEQTPEIIEEILQLTTEISDITTTISRLIIERREVVNDIKERYPYPD